MCSFRKRKCFNFALSLILNIFVAFILRTTHCVCFKNSLEFSIFFFLHNSFYLACSPENNCTLNIGQRIFHCKHQDRQNFEHFSNLFHFFVVGALRWLQYKFLYETATKISCRPLNWIKSTISPMFLWLFQLICHWNIAFYLARKTKKLSDIFACMRPQHSSTDYSLKLSFSHSLPSFVSLAEYVELYRECKSK